MADGNRTERDIEKGIERLRGRVFLCSESFVGTDGGTYICVFRYGTFKKLFGHIYVPVKADHVHVSASGIKQGRKVQGVLK